MYESDSESNSSDGRNYYSKSKNKKNRDDQFDDLKDTTSILSDTSRRKENADILNGWMSTLTKNSYIYDDIKDQFRKIDEGINITIFILSGLTTLLSTYKLSIEKQENATNIIFDGIISFFAFMIVILTQIRKYYKIDDTVNELTTYVGKIDVFLGSLVAGSSLPFRLRNDITDEELLNNYRTYHEIIISAPNIKGDKYAKSNEKYDKLVSEGGGETVKMNTSIRNLNKTEDD